MEAVGIAVPWEGKACVGGSSYVGSTAGCYLSSEKEDGDEGCGNEDGSVSPGVFTGDDDGGGPCYLITILVLLMEVDMVLVVWYQRGENDGRKNDVKI